jgi:hypothetical protein
MLFSRPGSGFMILDLTDPKNPDPIQLGAGLSEKAYTYEGHITVTYPYLLKKII